MSDETPATVFGPVDYVKAGSVPVVSGAIVASIFAMVARDTGATGVPVIVIAGAGAMIGLGLGFLINYDRRCPVCMASLARARGEIA